MRVRSLFPTPSMVVAMLALGIALSGVAWAQVRDNSVRSSDIRNGNVRHVDIGTNAVRSPEIARGAVGSSELANNTVRSIDIRNGGVGNADLAPNAVHGDNVGDNQLGAREIMEGALGQVPSAAHARRADSATNAGLAANAGLFDGLDLVASGAFSSAFSSVGAGECAEISVMANVRPEDLVLGTVRGGTAPTALPTSLSATFLAENGFVRLRLCNVSQTATNAFTVNWSFVVLRNTA